MMTEQDLVWRNIGLTFDFLREIVDNPSLLDKIPNGGCLEFIDKDFTYLEKEKGTMKEEGHETFYVKVENRFEILENVVV